MTELKRDELRKKLRELLDCAKKLGFYGTETYIDVNVPVVQILGDLIPHIGTPEWRIVVKLCAPFEEVNSCQSKCSGCKSQSR